MRNPNTLREHAARARSLANVNRRGSASGDPAYLLELADKLSLLELADGFERQADLLERAGQQSKKPTRR